MDQVEEKDMREPARDAEAAEVRRMTDTPEASEAAASVITVQEENLHHDRIAEAYAGSLGERFMLRQRERIDWICAQAGLGRILDVGCSQGTCPLLLGRAGAEVTGVDIDPEAIRYAVDHLLEEPIEVQARVRYLCADFLKTELPEGHYDAVVMTEFLEHLEEPLPFLEKGVRLLRDGGRMVVTVPFGINAFQDHKRTYYLAELYGQLSQYLTVTDVVFFDGWIGYLCSKNAAEAKAVPADLQLIAREEEAFFRMEQQLRERLDRYKERNEVQTARVQKLSGRLEEKTAQAAEAGTRLKEAAAELKGRTAELSAAEKRLAEQDRELEKRTAALGAAEKRLEAQARELESRSTDLSTAEKRLEERTADLSEAEKRLEAQARELEDRTAALEAAKKRLTEQDRELESRSTDLSTAEKRLEEWTADLSEAEKRLEAQARELEKRTADLSAAEKRLEEQDRELEEHSSALEHLKATLANKLRELKRKGEELTASREENRDAAEKLQEREEALKRSGEREKRLQETNRQVSRELSQVQKKLDDANRDRSALRERLNAAEQEYRELLDTPAGFRAHLKLLRKKFKEKRRAIRRDERAHKGSLLRRAAKKVPFLVAIVKKIRRRHPDAEFLFLEASRSDYRQPAAARPAASAVKTAGKAATINSAAAPPPSTWADRGANAATSRGSRSAADPGRSPAQEAAGTTEEPRKEEEKKPSAEAVPPKKPAKKPPKEEEADPRVMTREQEHFIDDLLPKLQALPESNGTRYFEKSRLRIGILCDEFFYDSVCSAADFVPLTPTNWREELPGLELLLVVTLWRGLHEEWRGVANVAHPDMEKINAIFSIIAECRDRGVPTVFYSKEDPPNYSVFIEFAKRCDYIFTTAQECLPDYVRDTGNPEPRVLRFSVNPLFHNPVGFRKFEKEKTVLFSGSWMVKYPERCKDMSMIFDGVLASGYGLHIIDRNYPSNRKYLFPPAYFPYVSPAVDHATLQKVHKLYDWAINTNSVQFSRTMFANRAYELQASGVLLLSDYSVGVNALLPNVFMAFSSEEVSAILNAYTPEETYERQIAGIRSVLRRDTCFDRMDELFRAIGLERQQKQRRIAVIGDPADPEVAASFARQSFPDKTLLAPESVTEEALADCDMVAFFGSGMRYGEFYLEDLANGFKYTACDYITKAAYLEGGELRPGTEHDYVSVMGSRFRTLFWREAFTAEALLGMEDGTALPNGYSVDHFQYDAGPAERGAERQEPYQLSVIVPVFNNGPHLYGKCFSSLRRSSIFRDMEILLVDDGSTDELTPKYITDLAARYPNVRPFFFARGGSGSSARALGKGAELATAEYLTFLEPGNEAVGDGYARMLEGLKGSGGNLAAGGCLQVGASPAGILRHGPLAGSGEEPALPANRFPRLDLETAVLRGSLLRDGKLPPLPAPEERDALYGWQLMETAEALAPAPETVLVRYTAAEELAVPAAEDFRDLLTRQQAKVEWLRSSGYLEAYLAERGEQDGKELLEKLARVEPEDEQESVRLVWAYLQLTADAAPASDPVLAGFAARCGSGDLAGALDYVKGTAAAAEAAPEA